MTDNERTELWKQLQTLLANAYERSAAATSKAEQLEALREITDTHSRLRYLKEAKDIRALLAKIESIGEDP
jgi:hypothetical protein